MGLIDSHAHLIGGPLEADIDGVLARAQSAGVEHVISIAVNMTEARRVLELARGDARVSPALGIHPHKAGNVTDEDWLCFAALRDDAAVVAFGEMGLDYHYDFADRKTQQRVFERQLELVAPTGRPIVIHAREAHDDTVAILQAAGYDGRDVVFHCFTGTPSEASNIAHHGWRLSFTGVVTFKNARELQAIATEYPLDQLIIETDSPFLSPVPVRNVKPNEPAHLVHTAGFLANLRRMDYDDFVRQTAENTRAFFKLPDRATL